MGARISPEHEKIIKDYGIKHKIPVDRIEMHDTKYSLEVIAVLRHP